MMNKEELISKWLDNNLNNKELEIFKTLEDYNDLTKLNNQLQAFKADKYETNTELENILSKIISKNEQPKTHWAKPIMRVAAILAICFSLYYYTTTINTTISTEFAQKTRVELPDESSVSLNSKSILKFNKNHWKKERQVELEGEAFFQVVKGSTFHVSTKSGIVTVYGTQFNIKQRENYFEVICYEGLVGVTHHLVETKLKPGDQFLIIDGKMIAKEKETNAKPSWLNNESVFKSLPYHVVISEFERQYNVNITLSNIDSKQLFTGSFTHKNMDVALKSITIPLHVNYIKTNNTILLKRE